VVGVVRAPGGVTRWLVTLRCVAIVRMFASAREAAGTARDDVPGATVGEVLHAARQRYGSAFADVLGTCRIWVNGDPAADGTAVGPTDEIAVLPPVSGGAG
jgi:molybdopterin converting factor small subunit